jgi:F-type H+-transporting ATPase subunit alpha
VAQVRHYEEQFHRFMDTRFANVLAGIREKKNLDDDLKQGLGSAIREFNEQFMASRAAGARA